MIVKTKFGQKNCALLTTLFWSSLIKAVIVPFKRTYVKLKSEDTSVQSPSSDVITEPFPHIIVKDALEEDIY